MMANEQELKVKAISLSDQCWAGMKEFYPDIERIGKGGLRIEDNRDRDIVRMVFLAVAGDLQLRAAD